MVQPGSYYGMLLAHFGVAVFIVGVTVVSGFQSETDVRMEVGDTASVAGYTFRLDSVTQVRGPNYEASRASVVATRGGQTISTLAPERRVYSVRGMAMTEVGIDRGFTRDLYVALGESVDNGKAWIVRVYVKPFIDWIWGGAFLMAMGGLLATTDRRYRAKKRSEQDLPANLGTAT